MPSTLSDFGRSSTRYGDIGYFYAFTIKFWFGRSNLGEGNVMEWCRRNCKGYYKIISYTHRNSIRNPKNPRKFDKRVVYVDRIYLSSKSDAAAIKLAYDVRKTMVKRPKIDRLKHM